MGYHICIANKEAFNISIEEGVYGNVGNAGESRNVVWGKIRDLYAVNKDDLIIFYIKNPELTIFGIYEVTSNPYICFDDIFNSNQKYPYRFNFRKKYNFPIPIPVFEFYNLIETGKINSMATLEKDINSSYRGIRQLFESEYQELLSLFYKYNSKIDPLDFEDNIFPIETINTVEANEIDTENLDNYSEPTEIVFNKIPSKNNKAILENVIHAYISYNLIHNRNEVRNNLELNNFSEIILEAPVFKTMQFRSDVLITFKKDHITYFYSFIELKKDKKIKIEDFSQLISYLKSFSISRNLPANSFEGIYISNKFDDKLIDYLQKRTIIEKENIIRLIKYSITNEGYVNLTRVL